MTASVLKQVEIWPPYVVKCDDLSIDHRVFGEVAQGFDDLRILSIERFPFSGKRLIFQVDCDSAVSVKFDYVFLGGLPDEQLKGADYAAGETRRFFRLDILDGTCIIRAISSLAKDG